MTDRIRVHELKIATRVGVSASERAEPRTVIINLELETDTRAAGVSDELSDTVDYSRLIKRVAEAVGGGEYRLIEHLAEQVAGLVMQENGIRVAKVEIIKPLPPVNEDVGAVSVLIERP